MNLCILIFVGSFYTDFWSSPTKGLKGVKEKEIILYIFDTKTLLNYVLVYYSCFKLIICVKSEFRFLSLSVKASLSQMTSSARFKRYFLTVQFTSYSISLISFESSLSSLTCSSHMSTACGDKIIKTSWPPVSKENSNGMATFEIFYFPDPVGDKSVSR